MSLAPDDPDAPDPVALVGDLLRRIAEGPMIRISFRAAL